MDVSIELEGMIAIYFNGSNYVYDGIEFSREDSKILAFQLIHTLQLMDMIMARENKRRD